MTAAELLLDLAERLTAYATFHGKAEGVRLALGYVTELQRMAGADL